jgi:hypothetical protein
MSQSQQYYRAGVLGVFDEILSAGDVHPLLKAYLQVALSKVVMRRAHEWGTLFAPRLLDDFQELKSIVPALLGRNDWLWKDKYPEQEKAMADFYAKRSTYSYLRESKINRSLIGEAIQAGFELAGYVNINREPFILPAAVGAKVIYGSPTPNVPAKILLRRTADEQWQKVETLAPFTPLLFFGGDREKILAAVASREGEDIDLVRSVALPFFH